MLCDSGSLSDLTLCVPRISGQGFKDYHFPVRKVKTPRGFGLIVRFRRAGVYSRRGTHKCVPYGWFHIIRQLPVRGKLGCCGPITVLTGRKLPTFMKHAQHPTVARFAVGWLRYRWAAGAQLPHSFACPYEQAPQVSQKYSVRNGSESYRHSHRYR